MDIIEKISENARELFHEARGSHRWDHTLRVLKVAEYISRVEKADIEVVQIAAYLHDIGRMKEDNSGGKLDHALIGAEMARDILRDIPLEHVKKENVIHCIETHRFRGNRIPETLEAQVLYDADKLDSIGAVGIGRAFLFAGEVGAKLHDKEVDVEKTEPYTEDDTAYREFLVKLSKIKDRMLTNEGRTLAEERHTFMVEFFERLNKEVDGVI
jgi:uncharacterized protein